MSVFVGKACRKLVQHSLGPHYTVYSDFESKYFDLEFGVFRTWRRSERVGEAIGLQIWLRFSCDQLWYQRNGIFKAAGYCFRTPRAFGKFGNAGCAYDDQSRVPLSDRDRKIINLTLQVERTKGCRQ